VCSLFAIGMLIFSLFREFCEFPDYVNSLEKEKSVKRV